MVTNYKRYMVIAATICLGTACSMQGNEHTSTGEAKADSSTNANLPAAEETGRYYDFNTLKKTLPENIGNYKAIDTAGGETLSKETSGGRQSYARQEYSYAERSIVVSVVDYSYARQTMKDLVGMYARNTTVQLPEVDFKEEKTPDSSVRVFSRLTKTDQYKSVIATYGDNVIVTIDGNDKTAIPFLMNIASGIFKKLPG